MLVSEYATKTINNRPLKYGTRQSYFKIIKSLGIWDLNIEDVTSSLILDKVDSMRSHNVKKNVFICLRSVFKDLGLFQDLPILQGISKEYDFPTQEELHDLIDRTKYRRILYLCMYAGLRVGEACAIRPSDLKGNRLIIQRQISQKGIMQPAKTVGSVVVPDWLGEFIKNMDDKEWWPEGKPSLRLTNHCFKLSKKTGVKVTPHLLRHWYATHLVKSTNNPELVRRQLRHARLDTTLQVYAQITSTDLDDLVNQAFKA